MYSRAVRKVGAVPIGTTSNNIGPGTYETAHIDSRPNLDSYAPFQSLSLRDDIFRDTGEVPGPGQYELRKAFTGAAKGGSSMANRSERFAHKQPDQPGPGTYDVVESSANNQVSAQNSNPIGNGNKENNNHQNNATSFGVAFNSTTDNNTNGYSGGGGDNTKITKQRVKFNRKKNAPSIQDPKEAFGFEESPNGELIPQAAPPRDPTLGPAYYINPSSGLASATSIKYKGTNFGKYASKRTDFVGKFGPGPGEYDIHDPVFVNVEHYHMKSGSKEPAGGANGSTQGGSGNQGEKRVELNLPRYPEQLVKDVQKQSIPGPGKYDQKRLFDDSKNHNNIMNGLNGQGTNINNNSSQNLDGIDIERPPFGIQTKRFDSFKTLPPGPGAYNETRTALNSLHKTVGLKRTPFAQSSVRFDADTVFHKSKSAPGPGQYRLNGFAEENLRKAIIDSNRKPAFGNSAERKYNLTKKDEFLKPGPANYNVTEKPFKSSSKNHMNQSSNFASGTKQRVLQTEETPGPTAYDVPKAYDFLVNTTRKAPRTKNAAKRQQSFNTVARRDFNLAKHDEEPGPGAYDAQTNAQIHAKVMTDQRWKSNPNVGLPGPADYDLAPTYYDTLLKGTFNATLNNPLILKQKARDIPAKGMDSVLGTASNGTKLDVSSIQKAPEMLKAT